jgi:hypothetical protein
MVKKKSVLRRYTDLPALLAILSNREITLLSPSTWDDRNDRHLMDAYKRAKRLKTLLALCFSESRETYHHWKVFAPGNSGVCIEFDRRALLDSLPSRGFSHSGITYRRLPGVHSLEQQDLPFIKRLAFEDEKEYRIVFSSRQEFLEAKSIPINLDVIHRIAINPWLHPSLFDAIEQTIMSVDGCSNLTVYRSRLIESPTWKRFAGKISPIEL